MLKKNSVFYGFFSLTTVCLTMWSGVAHAEHTRVTNPNAMSVELLGRALFYSVSYDRVLNDDLAAGIGLGVVPVKNSSVTTSLTMIPGYVNYYFMRAQGSPFATLGFALALSSGTAGTVSRVGGVNFDDSPVLPQIGVGYENRSDSGFLFRGTVYGMMASSQFYPWFGFALGYSF